MSDIGENGNGNYFVCLNEDKQLMPYKCPVCGGTGLVLNGFYSSTTGQWSSSSTVPETCRSCNGKGYILV